MCAELAVAGAACSVKLESNLTIAGPSVVIINTGSAWLVSTPSASALISPLDTPGRSSDKHPGTHPRPPGASLQPYYRHRANKPTLSRLSEHHAAINEPRDNPHLYSLPLIAIMIRAAAAAVKENRTRPAKTAKIQRQTHFCAKNAVLSPVFAPCRRKPSATRKHRFLRVDVA